MRQTHTWSGTDGADELSNGWRTTNSRRLKLPGDVKCNIGPRGEKESVDHSHPHDGQTGMMSWDNPWSSAASKNVPHLRETVSRCDGDTRPHGMWTASKTKAGDTACADSSAAACKYGVVADAHGYIARYAEANGRLGLPRVSHVSCITRARM